MNVALTLKKVMTMQSDVSFILSREYSQPFDYIELLISTLLATIKVIEDCPCSLIHDDGPDSLKYWDRENFKWR